jgi:hypothetical protein
VFVSQKMILLWLMFLTVMMALKIFIELSEF